MNDEYLFFVLVVLQGPVWTLCTNGDWLFSGSSDKTIKVCLFLSQYFADADGGIRGKCISSNVLQRCPETSNINPHRWGGPKWAVYRLMEDK